MSFVIHDVCCRYFHAGACVPVRKNLYIFGGLVRSKVGELEYEASKEMWKFAIDAKKWTGPIVSLNDVLTRN